MIRLANLPMSEQEICAMSTRDCKGPRVRTRGKSATCAFRDRAMALLAAAIFWGFLGSHAAFARFAAPQDPGTEVDTRSSQEIAAERRARQAANRGDKADASGNLEEAWKDYQEAIANAPMDKTIL